MYALSQEKRPRDEKSFDEEEIVVIASNKNVPEFAPGTGGRNKEKGRLSQPGASEVGAVAVQGIGEENQRYVSTVAESMASPPPRAAYSNPPGNPSTTPVTARVVDDREGDFDVLQERLERQGEQLERVLAGMENAPVASVMTNDEEAQVSKKHKNKEEEEGESTELHATSRLCGLKRRWASSIAAVVLIVIIVIVALGVSLASKSKESPSDSVSNLVCQVLADGSNLCCGDYKGELLCFQENIPYSGYTTGFYNCPTDATDVNHCDSCEVFPPGWDSVDDITCASCRVCDETISFDCSNIGAGACDCFGNCS